MPITDTDPAQTRPGAVGMDLYTSNPITLDSDTLMSDYPDNKTIGLDNVMPHEILQPGSVIPYT